MSSQWLLRRRGRRSRQVNAGRGNAQYPRLQRTTDWTTHRSNVEKSAMSPSSTHSDGYSRVSQALMPSAILAKARQSTARWAQLCRICIGVRRLHNHFLASKSHRTHLNRGRLPTDELTGCRLQGGPTVDIGDTAVHGGDQPGD